MGHVKPIQINKIIKTGILKPDRFFRLLSEHCDYVDPEVAKSFYMGLVRFMTKELRENGIIRLPYLGDFAMVKQKDKWGWWGKPLQRVWLTKNYSLKFYQHFVWRQYFAKLSKRSGREGLLDPREKLLGMNLDE